jgi:hypothetical protein
MSGVQITLTEYISGADPGFCSGGGVQGVQVNRGGGAPLRIKEKHFKLGRQSCSGGGGGAHPLHPPPGSAPAGWWNSEPNRVNQSHIQYKLFIVLSVFILLSWRCRKCPDCFLAPKSLKFKIMITKKDIKSNSMIIPFRWSLTSSLISILYDFVLTFISKLILA